MTSPRKPAQPTILVIDVGGTQLRALFAADPQRGTRFTVSAAGVHVTNKESA